MTARLYYEDSYLMEWSAKVVEAADGGARVYLDQTAFYPASGGQPCDTGEINGIAVREVVDEGERIAHILAAPLRDAEVKCRIDWVRRFDHMQQHTGQHLLSAVLNELFGISTLSFHLGSQVSTIDVGTHALDAGQVRQAERRANQRVLENHPVRVIFAGSDADGLALRKAPERTGELRIIEIESVDRSACGGTHVRATGEIGPVLIRKLDKIRGNVRIEFLCGWRALDRARADFEAMSRIGRALCAGLDEAPALVEAQIQRLNAAEKALQKLAAELAQRDGKALYEATPANARGFRTVIRELERGSVTEELRVLAQSFVSAPKAVFLALASDPPSVLLCVSQDSGLHAGNLVKEAVTAVGGRGGGSAQVAQGSVGGREALSRVTAALRQALPL